MKHVGKMKNNGAKILVVYRTLPDDPYNALVVGTQVLMDSYHDSLMSLVQDEAGQNATEFADILASRRFPDGSVMLEWLHVHGYLKKVPTNMVIMTPNTQASIQLDELNVLIAEQKGISVDDLAITDGTTPNKKSPKPDSVKTTSQSVLGEVDPSNMSPAEMRSRADALFKQAQTLRKQADEIDPPKRKTKTVKVEAE
jgi:hypothetical protein